MITKEIISFLILLGTLQVLTAENHGRSDDFPRKGLNHFDSNRKGFKESLNVAALQLQEDYKAWGDKKYKELDAKEATDNINHLRYNEITSGELDEKNKKFGDSKVYKNLKEKSYHEKIASGNEGKGKRESLLHDTDVNYINNKKEVSVDSEMISSKPTPKSKEKYQENYQNGNEFYMKRIKKDFYQNLVKIDITNPPSPNDTVLMARYIVHNVDWAALGTLSGRSPTKGSPFVCVKATSDGVKNESTGVPFFYMSSMDLCTQDLEKDNRVSVLVTLSETEYCKEKNLDPQDPRCAKLTLSGKIKRIKSGSDEEKFAKTALFSRHPAMATWPTDHNFYFTKLKIGQIILLDQFGGATYIKVKDYLNGKVSEPELIKK